MAMARGVLHGHPNHHPDRCRCHCDFLPSNLARSDAYESAQPASATRCEQHAGLCGGRYNARATRHDTGTARDFRGRFRDFRAAVEGRRCRIRSQDDHRLDNKNDSSAAKQGMRLLTELAERLSTALNEEAELKSAV